MDLSEQLHAMDVSRASEEARRRAELDVADPVTEGWLVYANGRSGQLLLCGPQHVWLVSDEETHQMTPADLSVARGTIAAARVLVFGDGKVSVGFVDRDQAAAFDTAAAAIGVSVPDAVPAAAPRPEPSASVASRNSSRAARDSQRSGLVLVLFGIGVAMVLGVAVWASIIGYYDYQLPYMFALGAAGVAVIWIAEKLS